MSSERTLQNVQNIQDQHKKTQTYCHCSLELQQTLKALENQLNQLNQNNQNFVRIRQTLIMALKQNQNSEQDQALFKQKYRDLSYKQLYQKEKEKSYKLNKEINQLQEQKYKNTQQKRQYKSTTHKSLAQKKKRKILQQCSQFTANEQIIQRKHIGNHFKQKEGTLYSKTHRSQSCQKMDIFMKTLNIQKNKINHRISSYKQQKKNLLILNLDKAQKDQFSIAVNNNGSHFINIKIQQNQKQKKSSKKKDNRQIVLKIIKKDLINLRN